MRKFAILLMSIILTGTPATWAAHDTAAYELPHEVANWMVDQDVLRNDGAGQYFEHLGCADVATLPITNPERSVAGYMILAIKRGEARLVAVEAWDFQREKVFSWVNRADYDALKACYEDQERLSV